MSNKRDIEPIIRKVSFAEAEEIEVEYYASVNWRESAATVEKMRRDIWKDEYMKGMVKVVKKKSLKDVDNDIE